MVDSIHITCGARMINGSTGIASEATNAFRPCGARMIRLSTSGRPAGLHSTPEKRGSCLRSFSPQRSKPWGAEWGLVQQTLLTGSLSLEDGQIPMSLRTTFPRCRSLIEFSHLIRLPYDEVLASYRAPDGSPRLGSFLAW